MSASGHRNKLNRRVREQIPGGGQLLDALDALNREADNPRRDRPAAQVAAIRRAAPILARVAQDLRDSVETAAAAAEKETRPAMPAASSELVSGQGPASLPSTPPAGPAAADGISLDLLRASSGRAGLAADEAWTPPAAVVGRMGRMPDADLAAIAGVGPTTLREARERLGIPAYAAPAARPFSGTALRAARAAAKLTAERLASAAGIGGGRAYVSQLEAGRRTPTAATVARLAAALGVPPASLYANDPTGLASQVSRYPTYPPPDPR